MANVLIERTDLENIANAIRNKSGTQNTLKVRQMASAINNLPKPSGSYNITENGTYDIKNYEDVVVNVSSGQITLQSKNVTIGSEGTTTIEADNGYDGLSDVNVTVNTETKTVKSTNQSQTITPTTGKFIDEIIVNPIELETRTVKSTNQSQTITPSQNKDGISQITVEPIELENITVNPSTSNQTINPGQNKDGINQITVNPVTSSIDQNIVAGNIKKDVEILGITGTYEGSSSQYVIDYAEIGYDFIPQGAELDGVNYAKQIMENWDSSITSANQLYQNNTNLLYFPLVDTSNINDFSRCFRNCTNLKVMPLINTSNFTFCNRSFEGDSNLVDIPQFDFSKVTALSSIFLNCLNLSDESLNNILGICINATAYMQAQAQSNWSLSVLGLSDYQKTRCQTLSNWNAFVNAGWSA